MTTFLINGGQGKMGQMITDILRQAAPDAKILSREQGQNIDEKFDIIIDFTLPKGAMEAFLLAKQNKAAFLCGTTNLPIEFIDEMRRTKDFAVFYSPNVSTGMYLFRELIKKAAADYPDYQRAMHEVHHAQKKDAPSGTAKMLAAAVDFPTDLITYERIGTVPGTHSFTLTSPTGDEKITLTHEAADRKLFAQSAVKVALWLLKQPAGFYDMHDYFAALNGEGK